jgi:hypothetical protein
MLPPATTANTHSGVSAGGGGESCRRPRRQSLKCDEVNVLIEKKICPNRFYVIGPIKRNSINNDDFLKFMISVWGGPRATKYLATPLFTHAVLGVISPEQRKYSQQGQEFFRITLLAWGPFTEEARVRSQASFCGISQSDTVTDFSPNSPVFSCYHHTTIAPLSYFIHLPS